MLRLRRIRKAGVAVAGAIIIGSIAFQQPPGVSAANQTVSWAIPTTSSVTINAGDTVTWDWGDVAPHSVTSVTGPATFDSGVLTGEDKSFAFTFTEAGTYTYRCVIHPDGMTGTVVVQAAQATATVLAATATSPAATATSPAATATSPAGSPTTAQPTATTGATTPLTGAQTITLTGDEEVPPVSTTTTGSFQWKVEGQSLRYVLKANGAGITMAHIHLGAKGANGPVVAFLFGPNQAGVSSVDVAGTITVAQLSGPLAGDWNGFISALNSGGTYVNVHSIEHPAGVVRRQIPAAQAPNPPSTGSGLEEGGSGNDYVLPTAAILIALVSAGGIVTIINRRRQSAS